MPWGLTFFKMGTRWGPKFQWNGDQMGTRASRMGTQKAHVFKISRTKLICWNKGGKNLGKIIYRVLRHLMRIAHCLLYFHKHWQTGIGFISASSVITSNQMVDIRYWLHRLFTHSLALINENGDLGTEMGTQWGPKNWKRSPWGPGPPNGDPCGHSGSGQKVSLKAGS